MLFPFDASGELTWSRIKQLFLGSCLFMVCWVHVSSFWLRAVASHWLSLLWMREVTVEAATLQARDHMWLAS